jgi:hypothetical protein
MKKNFFDIKATFNFKNENNFDINLIKLLKNKFLNQNTTNLSNIIGCGGEFSFIFNNS